MGPKDQGGEDEARQGVLDVAWVLERTGRSWGFVAFSAPSWIHALAKIVETIVRFTPTLPLPDQFFLRRVTIEQDTAESEKQAIPYQSC